MSSPGDIQKCATDGANCPAVPAVAEKNASTLNVTADLSTPKVQHTKIQPRVLLAYATCALIWGTTWYGIRVCIGPAGYPTFPAAALRFTISSLVLAAIWLGYKRKIKTPGRKELLWISIAGVLSGLGYGLLYSAEENIAGGVAAVLSATSPLVAAIIAVATRTEKMKKTTMYGSIVALLGVALVFHDRMQVSAAQAAAVGMLILTAFFNSSSNVVMKHNTRETAAVALNTVFFGAAAITLWLMSSITGGCALPYPLPLAPTIALLYLTFFGTLLAFACFFYLLKHTRLSTAMTLSFVTPIVALIVDAFFEKHVALTAESYFGIGIVLVGVAVSVLLKTKTK
jgi:drug/metabolite transporter (DMT)-like permease